MDTFVFPKEEPLYMGTKRHPCGSSRFEEIRAVFSCHGQDVTYTIFRCGTCGKYIIKGTHRDRKVWNLCDYQLLSSKTGSRILAQSIDFSHVDMSGLKFCNAITSKRESTIPNSVVWAASHPYQGGLCSGK